MSELKLIDTGDKNDDGSPFIIPRLDLWQADGAPELASWFEVYARENGAGAGKVVAAAAILIAKTIWRSTMDQEHVDLLFDDVVVFLRERLES